MTLSDMEIADRPGKPRSACARFFRPGGPLAAKHPAFESRPGQMEMAVAVDDALTENRKLIVEAGTGTGKTLAYLVPALLSGRRVVISTGTKALQEQLFFRDIPFLESVFERPLRVCYMKGRSNYACRQKIYEAESSPVLTGLEEVADFQIIQEWEKTTEIGDRAEIRTLPEDSTAWAKIDARSRTLRGTEMQAVRPLLHHADAPARRRSRHHHRQPSSVFRRSGGAAAMRWRAFCPITTP